MVRNSNLIPCIILVCCGTLVYAQNKDAAKSATDLIPISWSQLNVEEIPYSTVVTFKWGKRASRELTITKQKKVTAVNAERKIRRAIIKKSEDKYMFNSTIHNDAITKVEYTLDEPVTNQMVAVRLNAKEIIRDEIPTEVVNERRIVPEPADIEFEVQNKVAARIDRMAFYQKYRMAKSPRIYLEGSIEPAISFRTLVVKQEQLSSQSLLDQRSRDEKGRTVVSWKIRAGYQLDMSNSLYFDYSISKQGFKSYHRVDWATGLPLDALDNRNHYFFRSHSLGLGYSYSPFRAKRAAFTSDVGFIFNIAQKGLSEEFKHIGLSSRIAAGVKLTVVPCIDIRIMPNWTANFQRLRHGGSGDSRQEVLGTKMQAFGFSVSTRWYPMFHKRPKPADNKPS